MTLKPLLLVASLAAAGGAQAAPVAPVDPAKAQAALQAFERQLETHDSATAVLQAWCDAHGPAPGLGIIARSVAGASKTLPLSGREALRLKPGQTVRYRRVDLMCGGRVLSRADNWYLPGRLTEAMNRQLDRTQTPFGVVVKSLNFTRRNLGTDVLFSGVIVPPQVLRHTAVLLTGRAVPFSFVVETYTSDVLATDF